MLPVPLQQLDAALPPPVYAREGDAGADLIARADALLPCRGGRAVTALAASSVQASRTTTVTGLTTRASTT